jgi:thymidylate kinase
MHDVIIPAKNEGKDIISDRCYLCNLVYQSYDGVDLRWILDIQPKNLVFPDLVIFLYGDPKICAERSGEDASRLDAIQRRYFEILNSKELPPVNWVGINVDDMSIDDIYIECAMIISDNS